MSDNIKGLLVGAAFGALVGLGLRTFVINDALLFPGDTVVIGAVIFGIAGALWGDDFLEWLRNSWHHFF